MRSMMHHAASRDGDIVARAQNVTPRRRRHRPIRTTFRASHGLVLALSFERESFSANEPLTDELRASLWSLVDQVLFTDAREADARVTRRPRDHDVLRRVWSAPPIGGQVDRVPDDVASLLERWFLLVEPKDVYAFVETVRDHLAPDARLCFRASVDELLHRAPTPRRATMSTSLPR